MPRRRPGAGADHAVLTPGRKLSDRAGAGHSVSDAGSCPGACSAGRPAGAGSIVGSIKCDDRRIEVDPQGVECRQGEMGSREKEMA